VTGNLKGYDQLLNLVLDDTLEYLRGALPSVAALTLTLGSDAFIGALRRA